MFKADAGRMGLLDRQVPKQHRYGAGRLVVERVGITGVRLTAKGLAGAN